jgi:hypothetical protein
MDYIVYEKANPKAIHAICSSEESAQKWIAEIAPVYCSKGYFDDKSLTPESFAIGMKFGKFLIG